MARKPAPLKNRLKRGRAQVAVLRPEDFGKSIGEICWELLRPVCPLDVADAAELTERLERQPAFTSAEATGWVVGALASDLAYYGRDEDQNALMDDPKLRAIEDEVIAALGPEARWYTNSTHPLPRFRRAGHGRGWVSITRATFDLVVAARGNGLDLVLSRRRRTEAAVRGASTVEPPEPARHKSPTRLWVSITSPTAAWCREGRRRGPPRRDLCRFWKSWVRYASDASNQLAGALPRCRASQ